MRTEEKAKQVTDKYPDAKPVIGNLDDFDVIKEAASQADIVLREFRTSPVAPRD